LPVRVLVPPGAVDDAVVWDRVRTERVASMRAGLAIADLAVLPAWVEHQPRGLLMAIARGLPVIATPACGLPATLPWIAVPEGDAAALRAAIRFQLEARRAQPA
jgi:glycosyltransferase involved in cell wall biosynthesis